MADFLPDGSFNNPLAPIDWTAFDYSKISPPVQDIVPPSTVPTGFFNSFVGMSDDFGKWLTNPLDFGNFVSFSDNAGASAANITKAPGEIADAAGAAVNNAVNNATSKTLPYLALGGLVIAGVLLLQRPAR